MNCDLNVGDACRSFLVVALTQMALVTGSPFTALVRCRTDDGAANLGIPRMSDSEAAIPECLSLGLLHVALDRSHAELSEAGITPLPLMRISRPLLCIIA